MSSSKVDSTSAKRSRLCLLALSTCLLLLPDCGRGKAGGGGKGGGANPPDAGGAAAVEGNGGDAKAGGDATAAAEGPKRDALVGGPYPAMLVVQSQFVKVEGKSKPGPARLAIVRREPSGWKQVVIEDPDSNVFHKALPFTSPDGRKGIVTIGAMKAMLKFWWWDGGAWSQETLWSAKFGGKFDRLRDVEVGDVNGDGKDELVIATHDQGVIAVVAWDGKHASVTEVDRSADTFVHEIEIGDVDGDGKKEFFATPSKPNVVGTSQSGEVVRFSWDGKAYVKSVVERYETRHVKEIMAADLDGDGKATLLAVLEAELETIAGKSRISKPVEIRQFSFAGGGAGGGAATSRAIATIDDAQCRFLTWGDVDGDGTAEIVAAAMKTGLWLMRPGAGGTWSIESFDAESSGYEHSTMVADLDADGKAEVWVAADDQRRLGAYAWKDGRLAIAQIAPIPDAVITWNLVPASI